MEEREANNLTLEEAINSLKWRRALNRWYPHQYIVRSQGTATPERFDKLAAEIQASPYFDCWKGQQTSNLYLGGWKLWRICDVINRRRGEPPKDGLDDGEQSFVWRREHADNTA